MRRASGILLRVTTPDGSGAFTTNLDPATGIGTITITGPMDFGLLAIGLSHLWENERYSWRVLFDAREGDLSDIDSDSIQRAASALALARPESPPGRVAYLVSRDVDFGVSRMVEVLADTLPIESRTFRDYDEAWSWLSEGLAR